MIAALHHANRPGMMPLSMLRGLGQYDFGGSGGGGYGYGPSYVDILPTDTTGMLPTDFSSLPLSPVDTSVADLSSVQPYQNYVDQGIITQAQLDYANSQGMTPEEYLASIGGGYSSVPLPPGYTSPTAVGPVIAKPAPSPAGSGFQTSPTPQPPKMTPQIPMANTPTTPTPATSAIASAAQLASSLAAAAAQATAAGNPALAAQYQAQLAALTGSSGAALAPSWFTQSTIISGVPNWILLAGGGALALVLFGTGTRYTAQAPLRRKNPRPRRRYR